MNLIQQALIKTNGGNKYSFGNKIQPFSEQKVNQRFLNDTSLIDSIKNNIFAKNPNAMEGVNIVDKILKNVKIDPEVSSFFKEEKKNTNTERESFAALFNKKQSDVDVPIDSKFFVGKKIDKDYAASHVGIITSFDPFKLS